MTRDTHGAFAHVTEWVFDLDNTLYPRHCDLFGQIDLRMTAFIARRMKMQHAEARKLQKELYREYGTTLRGLMQLHDVDPYEFMDDVHDIDYGILPPNSRLGALIANLPGRKLIYTNGSTAHANNTLDALGINGIFDVIFDIAASDFIPKPSPEPFDKFIKECGVNGQKAAMFEDLPRNLEPAKALGMVTVLVTAQLNPKQTVEYWEHAESGSSYIDHRTDDLDSLLEKIIRQ